MGLKEEIGDFTASRPVPDARYYEDVFLLRVLLWRQDLPLVCATIRSLVSPHLPPSLSAPCRRCPDISRTPREETTTKPGLACTVVDDR